MTFLAHSVSTPSPSPDHERLYQIAEAQAGYFTATQAALAGFSGSLISYHLAAGQFERVRPRVYRLRRFPASPHEDLFIAWLSVGSRAVISHESALALYELSDVLPAEIHLTVPRTASRRRSGLRLHTGRLASDEVTRYAGLPVTTVARTIADVASAGLADELVLQAIHEAVHRGLARPEDIKSAATRRGGRMRRLVELALPSDRA